MGDGNCFFRASSWALYKTDEHHKRLRDQIYHEFKENQAWYDKDHPSFCSPFAKDPRIVLKKYEDYLTTTPKLGEWSDINHVLALSAVIQSTVELYSPTSSGFTSQYSGSIRGRLSLIHI